MDEKFTTQDEVIRMLATMSPPKITDQVFVPKYPDLTSCGDWHKYTAVASVAGLQAEPQFHANGRL
jgi:hypothetical protein